MRWAKTTKNRRRRKLRLFYSVIVAIIALRNVALETKLDAQLLTQEVLQLPADVYDAEYIHDDRNGLVVRQ